MRQELIEALQRLARGHVDAAETIVDLVMPKTADPRRVIEVPFPSAEHIEAVKGFDLQAE